MSDTQVEMPTAEGLLLDIADDGVCTITLSRPEKKNALTFDIYADLTRIFRELQDDERVKTVLLCGEGRAFCSGGDVHEIIGPLFEKDAKGLWEFTRMTCDLIENMRGLSKPIRDATKGVRIMTRIDLTKPAATLKAMTSLLAFKADPVTGPTM